MSKITDILELVSDNIVEHVNHSTAGLERLKTLSFKTQELSNDFSFVSDKADQAKDIADAASLTADLAEGKADFAIGKVNDAFTLADNAMDVATNALNKANTAESLAVQGIQSANNANSNANNATNLANNANANANTAIDLATEAIDEIAGMQVEIDTISETLEERTVVELNGPNDTYIGTNLSPIGNVISYGLWNELNNKRSMSGFEKGVTGTHYKVQTKELLESSSYEQTKEKIGLFINSPDGTTSAYLNNQGFFYKDYKIPFIEEITSFSPSIGDIEELGKVVLSEGNMYWYIDSEWRLFKDYNATVQQYSSNLYSSNTDTVLGQGTTTIDSSPLLGITTNNGIETGAAGFFKKTGSNNPNYTIEHRNNTNYISLKTNTEEIAIVAESASPLTSGSLKVSPSVIELYVGNTANTTLSLSGTNCLLNGVSVASMRSIIPSGNGAVGNMSINGEDLYVNAGGATWKKFTTYDTTYNNITSYVNSNFWNENGNVVVSGANKIGSTNNIGISFITTNIERARIDNTGQFFIDGIYIGQKSQNRNNIFIGDANTGGNNTTGSFNIFKGINAGLNNTTGNFNIFNGVNAGFSNITGSLNIFEGADAGANNTTGSFNIFNGVKAGYLNITGSNNTIIGSDQGAVNMNNEIRICTGATKRFHSVDDLFAFGSNVATPHSTMQSGGSFATKLTTTETDLTLSASHNIVLCTASLTITLPTAANIVGRQYTIKNVSNNPITINTTSCETIDGSLSITLSNQHKYVTIVSDGSNWFIIGQN